MKYDHYFDLHNHLYGCINAQTLFEIGKNNPSPRWEIFTKLHEEISGEKIDTKNFFTIYKNINDFKKLYLFNYKAPFIEFQSKFNLIIALVKLDEQEIQFLTKKIMQTHLSDGVQFAEYRIMYSPFESKEGYFQKTKSACYGLKNAEKALEKKISGRLVVSIHRDQNFETQYEWLKEFMRTDETIREYLVGIDFCSVEEGFPPKEKKIFFQKVLSDNKLTPNHALSILYHVGESFNDKTPKSAVRWILESCLNGAHRLGHCLALGIDPEFFRKKIFREKVSETLDQLNFELKNYQEIKQFGKIQPKDAIIQQIKNLKSKHPNEIHEILFDQNSENELRAFQDFSMKEIQKKNTVIESCPTSNLYIGMIEEKFHPLKRFADFGLNLTIGTDDPGIFNTNIQEEYSKAKQFGVSFSQIEMIQKNNPRYSSEILSGRIKNH